MTREETLQVLMTISAAYPSWGLGKKGGLELEAAVAIWHAALQDDDYSTIYAGCIDYIRSDISGFAPSIGQIRHLAAKMAHPDAFTDKTEEAVAMVRQAVRKGYYRTQEAYDELPEEVQKAVGSPETLKAWSRLTEENFESVALSHFRKSYRTYQERTRRDIVSNPYQLVAPEQQAQITTNQEE